MNYTPSPWKWLYHKDPNDGEILYRVIPIQRVTDGAILSEADARLVAAAPDLLEACEAALEAGIPMASARARVRAAIIKAKAEK